jgi:hypothetical protein
MRRGVNAAFGASSLIDFDFNRLIYNNLLFFNGFLQTGEYFLSVSLATNLINLLIRPQLPKTFLLFSHCFCRCSIWPFFLQIKQPPEIILARR